MSRYNEYCFDIYICAFSPNHCPFKNVTWLLQQTTAATWWKKSIYMKALLDHARHNSGLTFDICLPCILILRGVGKRLHGPDGQDARPAPSRAGFENVKKISSSVPYFSKHR